MKPQIPTVIPRYFTATGLVVLLYGTVLTIGRGECAMAQALELRQLFVGSSCLARALRISEDTILYLPILDDFGPVI